MATGAVTHDDHAHDDAHHTPTGWRRFVYSTNHKDIGTMYLVFAIVAGLIGGFFSMMMRAELMYPGLPAHEQHLLLAAALQLPVPGAFHVRGRRFRRHRCRRRLDALCAPLHHRL